MTKVQLRDSLARDVARYQQAGGVIEHLPTDNYETRRDAMKTFLQFGNAVDGPEKMAFFEGIYDT